MKQIQNPNCDTSPDDVNLQMYTSPFDPPASSDEVHDNHSDAPPGDDDISFLTPFPRPVSFFD